MAVVEGNIGNILTMFTVYDRRLYFVCDRGIGSAQMADQVDPQRVNPGMPQVIQTTEMRYGATTPFISRTICVTNELFRQPYLPQQVVRDEMLSKALAAAEALAEIQDNVETLAAAEAEVRRQIDAGNHKAHVVPKTKNLTGLVEGSIGALRKVALIVQGLALAFYPRSKPNDPFAAHIRGALHAQLAADDPALPAMDWCLSQIERCSNYRNAMIHGDEAKRLIILDYTLEPDQALIAPTIEVIHSNTPLPRMDVGQFLRDALESISMAFEDVAVICCNANCPDILGMRARVVRTDQDLGTGTKLLWQSEWLEGYPKIVAGDG